MGTLRRQSACLPRKWDYPPRGEEGDRSVFSADVFSQNRSSHRKMDQSPASPRTVTTAIPIFRDSWEPGVTPGEFRAPMHSLLSIPRFDSRGKPSAQTTGPKGAKSALSDEPPSGSPSNWGLWGRFVQLAGCRAFEGLTECMCRNGPISCAVWRAGSRHRRSLRGLPPFRRAGPFGPSS